MNFSQRLRELLIEKGQRASRLAEYLGTNQTTVSGWLHGGRSPSFDYILPICDFLQVSPYYLLSGEQDPNSGQPLSEDRRKLLDCYDLLTDFERGELCAELRLKTAGRTPDAPDQAHC